MSDDDPTLPRLTHPAEYRAQLAAHLGARGLPHNFREELSPRSQIRWIQWGSTNKFFRTSPAGGEEFDIPDNAFTTLVNAIYGRPLTWQVHLLLDLRKGGGWAIGDTLKIVWEFKIGCGRANIEVPVVQSFTIAAVGPTNFVQTTQPYAAQAIQIQAASVHLSAIGAGDRQMSWSAWVAPYVE